MSDVKRFDIELDVVKPTVCYANGTQEPFWDWCRVYLTVGGWVVGTEKGDGKKRLKS